MLFSWVECDFSCDSTQSVVIISAINHVFLFMHKCTFCPTTLNEVRGLHLFFFPLIFPFFYMPAASTDLVYSYRSVGVFRLLSLLLLHSLLLVKSRILLCLPSA